MSKKDPEIVNIVEEKTMSYVTPDGSRFPDPKLARAHVLECTKSEWVSKVAAELVKNFGTEPDKKLLNEAYQLGEGESTNDTVTRIASRAEISPELADTARALQMPPEDGYAVIDIASALVGMASNDKIINALKSVKALRPKIDINIV